MASYQDRAAEGMFGTREAAATLYQDPAIAGRQSAISSGDIMPIDPGEEHLEARRRVLADMLEQTDPSTQPYKASLIRQEMDEIQRTLDRRNLNEGASSARAAARAEEQRGRQQTEYEARQASIPPTEGTNYYPEMGFGSEPGGTGNVDTGYYAGEMGYGSYEERPTPTSDVERLWDGSIDWSKGHPTTWQGQQMSQQRQGGYQTPSYMRGWITRAGVRPLGAQTEATPIQKQALWEQRALEEAGGVGSLEEYMNRVEPFISLWGQTHEAGSKRLFPQSRGRATSWRAARQ